MSQHEISTLSSHNTLRKATDESDFIHEEGQNSGKQQHSERESFSFPLYDRINSVFMGTEEQEVLLQYRTENPSLLSFVDTNFRRRNLEECLAEMKLETLYNETKRLINSQKQKMLMSDKKDYITSGGSKRAQIISTTTMPFQQLLYQVHMPTVLELREARDKVVKLTDFFDDEMTHVSNLCGIHAICGNVGRVEGEQYYLPPLSQQQHGVDSALLPIVKTADCGSTGPVTRAPLVTHGELRAREVELAMIPQNTLSHALTILTVFYDSRVEELLRKQLLLTRRWGINCANEMASVSLCPQYLRVQGHITQELEYSKEVRRRLFDYASTIAKHVNLEKNELGAREALRNQENVEGVVALRIEENDIRTYLRNELYRQRVQDRMEKFLITAKYISVGTKREEFIEKLVQFTLASQQHEGEQEGLHGNKSSIATAMISNQSDSVNCNLLDNDRVRLRETSFVNDNHHLASLDIFPIIMKEYSIIRQQFEDLNADFNLNTSTDIHEYQYQLRALMSFTMNFQRDAYSFLEFSPGSIEAHARELITRTLPGAREDKRNVGFDKFTGETDGEHIYLRPSLWATTLFDKYYPRVVFDWEVQQLSMMNSIIAWGNGMKVLPDTASKLGSTFLVEQCDPELKAQFGLLLEDDGMIVTNHFRKVVEMHFVQIKRANFTTKSAEDNNYRGINTAVAAEKTSRGLLPEKGLMGNEFSHQRQRPFSAQSNRGYKNGGFDDNNSNNGDWPLNLLLGPLYALKFLQARKYRLEVLKILNYFASVLRAINADCKLGTTTSIINRRHPLPRGLKYNEEAEMRRSIKTPYVWCDALMNNDLESENNNSNNRNIGENDFYKLSRFLGGVNITEGSSEGLPGSPLPSQTEVSEPTMAVEDAAATVLSRTRNGNTSPTSYALDCDSYEPLDSVGGCPCSNVRDGITGVFIMEAWALEEMARVEERLLRTASYYVTKYHDSLRMHKAVEGKAEKDEQGTPKLPAPLQGTMNKESGEEGRHVRKGLDDDNASEDTLAVLYDLYDYELRYLKSKMNVVDDLREAYLHSLNRDEASLIAQQMLELMISGPRLAVSDVYFKPSYSQNIEKFNLIHSLMRNIISYQVAIENRVLLDVHCGGFLGTLHSSTTTAAANSASNFDNRGVLTASTETFGIPEPIETAGGGEGIPFQKSLLPHTTVIGVFAIYESIGGVRHILPLVNSSVQTILSRFRPLKANGSILFMEKMILEEISSQWQQLESEETPGDGSDDYLKGNIKNVRKNISFHFFQPSLIEPLSNLGMLTKAVRREASQRTLQPLYDKEKGSTSGQKGKLEKALRELTKVNMVDNLLENTAELCHETAPQSSEKSDADGADGEQNLSTTWSEFLPVPPCSPLMETWIFAMDVVRLQQALRNAVYEKHLWMRIHNMQTAFILKVGVSSEALTQDLEGGILRDQPGSGIRGAELRRVISMRKRFEKHNDNTLKMSRIQSFQGLYQSENTQQKRKETQKQRQQLSITKFDPSMTSVNLGSIEGILHCLSVGGLIDLRRALYMEVAHKNLCACISLLNTVLITGYLESAYYKQYETKLRAATMILQAATENLTEIQSVLVGPKQRDILRTVLNAAGRQGFSKLQPVMQMRVTSWPVLMPEEEAEKVFLTAEDLRRFFIFADVIDSFYHRAFIYELELQSSLLVIPQRDKEKTATNDTPPIREQFKDLRNKLIDKHCEAVALAIFDYGTKYHICGIRDHLRGIILDMNAHSSRKTNSFFIFGGIHDVIGMRPHYNEEDKGTPCSCLISKDGQIADIRYVPHYTQVMVAQFETNTPDGRIASTKTFVNVSLSQLSAHLKQNGLLFCMSSILHDWLSILLLLQGMTATQFSAVNLLLQPERWIDRCYEELTRVYDSWKNKMKLTTSVIHTIPIVRGMNCLGDLHVSLFLTIHVALVTVMTQFEKSGRTSLCKIFKLFRTKLISEVQHYSKAMFCGTAGQSLLRVFPAAWVLIGFQRYTENVLFSSSTSFSALDRYLNKITRIRVMCKVSGNSFQNILDLLDNHIDPQFLTPAFHFASFLPAGVGLSSCSGEGAMDAVLPSSLSGEVMLPYQSLSPEPSLLCLADEESRLDFYQQFVRMREKSEIDAATNEAEDTGDMRVSSVLLDNEHSAAGVISTNTFLTATSIEEQQQRAGSDWEKNLIFFLGKVQHILLVLTVRRDVLKELFYFLTSAFTTRTGISSSVSAAMMRLRTAPVKRVARLGSTSTPPEQEATSKIYIEKIIQENLPCITTRDRYEEEPVVPQATLDDLYNRNIVQRAAAMLRREEAQPDFLGVSDDRGGFFKGTRSRIECMKLRVTESDLILRQCQLLIMEVNKLLILKTVGELSEVVSFLRNEGELVKGSTALAYPAGPGATLVTSPEKKVTLAIKGAIFAEFCSIMMAKASVSRADESKASVYSIPESSLTFAMTTVSHKLENWNCSPFVSLFSSSIPTTERKGWNLQQQQQQLYQSSSFFLTQDILKKYATMVVNANAARDIALRRLALSNKTLEGRLAAAVSATHTELLKTKSILINENESLRSQLAKSESTVREGTRLEFAEQLNNLETKLRLRESQFSSYKTKLFKDMQSSLEKVKRSSMFSISNMKHAPIHVKRQALKMAVSDDELNRFKTQNSDLRQTVQKIKLWYELKLARVQLVHERESSEMRKENENICTNYWTDRTIVEGELAQLRKSLEAAQTDLSKSELEMDVLRRDLQLQMLSKKNLVAWKIRRTKQIDELTKKLARYEAIAAKYDIEKLVEEHERRLQEEAEKKNMQFEGRSLSPSRILRGPELRNVVLSSSLLPTQQLRRPLSAISRGSHRPPRSAGSIKSLAVGSIPISLRSNRVSSAGVSRKEDVENGVGMRPHSSVTQILVPFDEYLALHNRLEQERRMKEDAFTKVDELRGEKEELLDAMAQIVLRKPQRGPEGGIGVGAGRERVRPATAGVGGRGQ